MPPAKARKGPKLVKLSTLRAGDTFLLEDSGRTGVLLGDPNYGSVAVRLVRPSKDPDVKPEVQYLRIAPGTEAVHTGHTQGYKNTGDVVVEEDSP